MHYTKLLLLLLPALLALAGCSDDDLIPVPQQVARRAVLVYMAADNSLNGYASQDLQEMVKGSKELAQDEKLLVFVDQKGELPYIAWIADGKMTNLAGYAPTADYCSADPVRMKEALELMMRQCPAESYGLVLWGHAGGWAIEDDSIAASGPKRAYGQDTGNGQQGDTKWINIPTLARTLEQLPVRLDFIMADCCCMMTAEVAYELRHAAKWLIGSPAEIPGVGAPYDKVAKLFFGKDDTYPNDIINAYADSHAVPLSAIRLGEMDAFADATRQALAGHDMSGLSTDGAIYYYKRSGMPLYYDMRDVLGRNDMATAAYAAWEEQWAKTVPYRRLSTTWDTVQGINFASFKPTAANYGGISMHFPLPRYQSIGYNENVKKMSWWWRVFAQ